MGIIETELVQGIQNPTLRLERDLDRINVLCGPGEQAPEAVVNTVKLLSGSGMWFGLGRCNYSTSCTDAAQNRVILGHEGIPLGMEAKTAMLQRRGYPGFVLATYNADLRLDVQKLERLVECDLEWAPSEAGLGEYGLMSPFMGGRLVYRAGAPRIETPGILQVFDRRLRERLGTPPVITTNAGNHTWFVQVMPSEMMSRVVGRVRNITEDESAVQEESLTTRRYVVLTGNGPESGSYVHGRINHWVREILKENNRGDSSMPEVTIDSFPGMGESMELSTRLRTYWPDVLNHAIRDSRRGGGIREANGIVFACGTSQVLNSDLEEGLRKHGVGTEVISMADISLEYLRGRGVKRVFILGTRWVGDPVWSGWLNKFQQAGVEAKTLGERGLRKLEDVTYDIKEGRIDQNIVSRVNNILYQEVIPDMGDNQEVLNTLTELSLFFNAPGLKGRQRYGKTITDGVDLTAQAIACKATSRPFPFSI